MTSTIRRNVGVGSMLLGAICLVAVATPALAEVTSAKKAKFTGRVNVSGKAPNTTIYVWQSSTPGGSEYVNTAFPITTDANGNGTVSIPNTSSGTLLVGHNVKTGTLDEPSTQTPATVIKARGWLWDPWFASVDPGMNGPALCTLSQSVHGQEGVLSETWEPGTVYTLMINPRVAQWVNMGCQVHSTGDLQVELVQLSLQSISVRVLNDPTPFSDDDVIISGVGLNVLAPPGTEIPIYLGFQGCTNLLQDWQFIERICGQGAYVYETLAVRNTCDPDVNCDGSADGFDVEAMEQAVGGDLANYCQADADFNGDGSVDGFDVEAVENTVGSGVCP